ncbi:MAG: flavodoxin domain-containing protein [Sedimentibacter sp.]
MENMAIIYASVHHKNTKKLVEGIALEYKVDLFEVSEASNIDFTQYKIVGFASGIYMSSFHKSLFNFLEEHPVLPNKAFLMYTSGSENNKYAESFIKKLAMKNIAVIGVYNCKGYDTYGHWKLIGGIAKGHPSKEDISKGIDFINNVIVKNL